jgi:hypothetical protein
VIPRAKYLNYSNGPLNSHTSCNGMKSGALEG